MDVTRTQNQTEIDLETLRRDTKENLKVRLRWRIWRPDREHTVPKVSSNYAELTPNNG